jgi:regulator of sirC expression with transglutaminase-like and TPR domain
LDHLSPSLRAFQRLLKEEPFSVFKTAITVSAQDQEKELLLQEWEDTLDELAEDVKLISQNIRAPNRLLECVNTCLFDDYGFRGNHADYYNPENSYLDQVIEKKLGIPLSLSIIYIEVAKRAGIPVVGVGIPGHFMVKIEGLGRDIFADPFNLGRLHSRTSCNELVSTLMGRPIQLPEKAFEAASERTMIVRLLMNLRTIYLSGDRLRLGMETCERLLLLQPKEPSHYRTRGLLHYQLGESYLALRDLTTYRDMATKPDPEADAIAHIIKALRELVSTEGISH